MPEDVGEANLRGLAPEAFHGIAVQAQRAVEGAREGDRAGRAGAQRQADQARGAARAPRAKRSWYRRSR